MPNKKKKYNARFPPARKKKIMQTDEDVGKVAAAVPVIISRALEFFIEALIEKSVENTKSKNAKTLSAAHIKQTITSERKFDFLKDLVANIPDIQQCDEEGNYNPDVAQAGPSVVKPAPKKTSSLPGHVPKKRGRPKKIRNEDDEVEKPVKRNCVEIPMSSDDDELESDNEKAESNHERLGTDESGLTTHHMTYLDSNIAGSLGSNVAASLGSNIAGSLGSNVAGSLGSNVAGSLGSNVAGSLGSNVAGSLSSQFVNLQSAVVTPLYLQSTVKPAETPSASNVPTAGSVTMAVDLSSYDENNKTDATNEHAESKSDIKTNKNDSGGDFTTSSSSGHSCDRDTQEIPKRDLQLADNCEYPSTVLHPICKIEANIPGSVLGQQSIEFSQRRTSVNPDSGSTNSATPYLGNTDQSHEAQSSQVNIISSQSGGGKNYKNTSLQNIHAETPLHKLAAISSLVRLADQQPVSTVTSSELERLQKITPHATPKQEIRDVKNAAVNSTSSCQNLPEVPVNTAAESLRVWEKSSQVKCSESSHLLDTMLKKEPLVSGSDFKQQAGNGDGGSQSTGYLEKNTLTEMQQLINKNTNAIPFTNESFLSASNVNVTQSYYPAGFNTLSPTNNNKLRLMPPDGLLKSAGQVPPKKVTDQWSPTKAGVLDLSVPKEKNNIQVSNNSSESLIDHRIKTEPESHNANNKEQRSQSSVFSNVKATAPPTSTLPEVIRPAGTIVGQHGMFAGIPPPAMMPYPPPVMGLPYPVIPAAYAPYPPVNMIPAFHGQSDQIRLGMMSAFAAQPQPVTSATPGYYLPFPPSTMAGYPAPVTTTNHTNYDSTGKRN